MLFRASKITAQKNNKEHIDHNCSAHSCLPIQRMKRLTNHIASFEWQRDGLQPRSGNNMDLFGSFKRRGLWYLPCPNLHATGVAVAFLDLESLGKVYKSDIFRSIRGSRHYSDSASTIWPTSRWGMSIIRWSFLVRKYLRQAHQDGQQTSENHAPGYTLVSWQMWHMLNTCAPTPPSKNMSFPTSVNNTRIWFCKDKRWRKEKQNEYIFQLLFSWEYSGTMWLLRKLWFAWR